MASILIVDDQAINRKFLQALLSCVDHVVIEAGDGLEALNKVRALRPQLVITDVLMPTMDGVEFTRRLRADPVTAGIPVIFYTATYRLFEARAKARTCGVSIVLAKPAEPQAILDAVATALRMDAGPTLQPITEAQQAFLSEIAPVAHSPELADLQRRLHKALRTGAGSDTDPVSLGQGADRPALGMETVQVLSFRLAALLELSMDLSLERDPQQLLELFCRAAQNIMNAKCTAFGVYDSSLPKRFTWAGMSDSEVDAISDALGSSSGVLDKALNTRKICRPRDMEIQELDPSHPLRRDFLLVPVTLGARPYGWFYLADKFGSGTFTDEDEQFSIMLVTLLTPVYENLILYEEAKQYVAQLERESTVQKEQQNRIARLSRISAVLSGINSAIVRIRDRNELFQEACRIAVDEGTFGMAWVGVIDPDTQEGSVVAWFGGKEGYVDKIRLTARAGLPNSERPACVAVREMRPVICNDIGTDMTLAPLREDLLQRGHRSVAAFPLMLDNRADAVIALFGNEVGMFDEEELKLLNELASDLSFGMRFIAKEEKLSYLAYYDALTGLPNGTLFHDRLTQFLHATKNGQGMVAAILLDLDHFSQLNNALGRHAGDQLLKQVAERLNLGLHEPYSLARIGNDKFAIAVTGLAQVADAVAILEQQIFGPLERPYMLEQKEIRMTARAGLALYPTDGNDAETLHKHAEVALKKAKSTGERYLFYASQMNAAIAARLALEGELQVALDAHQFVMYFQPRIDLRNGRIAGAEALIRWRHPQRGLVPPLEFIPLAEETGLIVPIGAWAIDAVCAQQAAWLAQQIVIVPVAVNLSAVQFKNGGILQTIRDTLATHRLEQKYIEFELTESIVMEDPEEATRNLNILKKMGLKLSLDDFGTGYSSLAYLKRFPFDFVKIDRAFVTDLTRNTEDAAITNTIIAMAHGLNLRVVAEGVETEGQFRYLRKQGCDEMQGYYFSPPVPAAAFEAMLREDKRLALEQEPAEAVQTLLIVDDEPNNLHALRRALRNDGYHILTALSAQEGLDLLAVNPVQVIVADQRMPAMSGSAFLGIVKGLYPDTIRIVLTGYTDVESILDSVNRGAVFKFLTKPWDDDMLRENIRDAFRRYRPEH